MNDGGNLVLNDEDETSHVIQNESASDCSYQSRCFPSREYPDFLFQVAISKYSNYCIFFSGPVLGPRVNH